MKRPILWPVCACIVFSLLAFLLIGLPGIQNDEAIFVLPIYQAHHHGLMILSYLGALKSIVYTPISNRIRPSVWTLRVPVAIICLCTIWLTGLLARRIGGWRAAAIATMLLATDPSFLLTGTLDWGPVAFQHFFLMLGIVCLVRWMDSKRNLILFGAFLAFGLGLWDKALFIWPLSGLAISALCVYPREVLRNTRLKVALIAAAGLSLGSLPLIVYNVQSGGHTIGQNSSFKLSEFAPKIVALKKTLDGSAMFDVLRPQPGTPAGSPALKPWQRASEWLAQHAGDHQQTPFIWVMIAALVIATVAMTWSERRLMIFLLLAASIATFEMFVTKGAGTSVHHDVLLWPLPILLVALPFARVAQSSSRVLQAAAILVITALSAENLLTDNQYLAELSKEGTSQYWTDAIFPLANYVKQHPLQQFVMVDWGLMNPLLLLTRGRPQFENRFDCLADTSAQTDCGIPDLMIRPEFLFVEHTRENQIFPNVNEHLEHIAAAHGEQEQIDQVITDSHGRPMFKVVHFSIGKPEASYAVQPPSSEIRLR